MLHSTASLRHRLGLTILALASVLLTLPTFAADPVVAEGSTWDKRTAKIQGAWQIVEREGGLVLVLGEDFKTKKAPDLKAFLVPVSPADVGKREIPAGALRVGLLDSHKGAQELALPAGASLDGYRSLVIHCERFSKVWAVTPLP